MLLGLRDLRIAGESFTPEDVPIKPVLLTVKAHRDKKWYEIGQKYSKAKFFSLMRAAQPADKLRPIFIEGVNLLKHKSSLIFLGEKYFKKCPFQYRLSFIKRMRLPKHLQENVRNKLEQ